MRRELKTLGKFQSTRPVKGATAEKVGGFAAQLVSIHAPREGRDALIALEAAVEPCFNPRAP